MFVNIRCRKYSIYTKPSKCTSNARMWCTCGCTQGFSVCHTTPHAHTKTTTTHIPKQQPPPHTERETEKRIAKRWRSQRRTLAWPFATKRSLRFPARDSQGPRRLPGVNHLLDRNDCHWCCIRVSRSTCRAGSPLIAPSLGSCRAEQYV